MRIERLGAVHDLSRFSCGAKQLDAWLRNHALENQRRNLSRTFVMLNDANQVVGYYSLSMGGVTRDELPGRLGRGLPRYQVGVVLLARLAVDTRYQRQGLGRDLMAEAIRQAVEAGSHVAARFIAVDPVDHSARDFYRLFGFVNMPSAEHRRMFVRLDDAALSLGLQRS